MREAWLNVPPPPLNTVVVAMWWHCQWLLIVIEISSKRREYFPSHFAVSYIIFLNFAGGSISSLWTPVVISSACRHEDVVLARGRITWKTYMKNNISKRKNSPHMAYKLDVSLKDCI